MPPLRSPWLSGKSDMKISKHSEWDTHIIAQGSRGAEKGPYICLGTGGTEQGIRQRLKPG